MKYKNLLIAVSNVDISRKFYEEFLNQKVKYDFGENITFEEGFAIQLKPHFANMVTVDEKNILSKSNNFELYFEEDDIDNFIKKLNKKQEIEIIHGLKQHPWGQRVVRFYDPDNHIIEVGENMEVVILRYLSQGLSIEETAKITQYPIEFVKMLVEGN